jgi:Nucleotidyltransferase domain
LIIGGSVAKGRAQPDSDVDILLVATAEEYAQRATRQDFWYVNREICDYPNGYVEGKIIDMPFLRDVADHGSEPARAAFVGAFPGYTRISELLELLARIPVYQEADRQAKIRSFYSQVTIFNWYVGEAEKRADRYLMTQAVANMTLYAGRLLLAHNRILYPYHKWFMYELRHAASKPDGFMDIMEQLLTQPSKEHAQALCDSLTAFHDWGVSYPQAIVKFFYDVEWNWRDGHPPLQDW